jgi:hypothetical protein
MSQKIDQVDILTRREIEAGVAGPLIKAFAEEIGEEKAMEIAGRVIASHAKESGQMLREFVGGNTLEHFSEGMSLWSKGDAIEFDVLEQTPDKLSMNVTRCRYAEMYREMGLEDQGFLLSCGRDYALVEGFNSKIKLTRTQTIMEGDGLCDFRFEVKDD